MSALVALQEIKVNPQGSSFSSFWPLVVYHVSFFIFITTIGLNIIFGIIVDTFSELRDLKVADTLKMVKDPSPSLWSLSLPPPFG